MHPTSLGVTPTAPLADGRDAPNLMLDVNAALEGDMEEHFTAYDPRVNLDVFHTFCDRYGIKVSEEGAASLMEFFEGFECGE